MSAGLSGTLEPVKGCFNIGFRDVPLEEHNWQRAGDGRAFLQVARSLRHIKEICLGLRETDVVVRL